MYYNLFPGALASAFLLLKCIEVSWIRLQLEFGGGGVRTAMNGVFYWGAISVFSLVSAGAWYLAGKMDLVIVHVLGLLIAFPSVLERYVDIENKYIPRVGKPSQEDPPSLKEHSWRQSIWTISGYSLGLVQILHIFVMFLFFLGGMDAWTSDFSERLGWSNDGSLEKRYNTKWLQGSPLQG